MQQCLMEYPRGLSAVRDTYQCPFAVVEVQASSEGLWEQRSAQEARAGQGMQSTGARRLVSRYETPEVYPTPCSSFASNRSSPASPHL